MGAFFATLLTGFFISRVLSQFQLMICEKDDLTLAHPTCTPALPYIPVPVPLPQGMQGFLNTVVRNQADSDGRPHDHSLSCRRWCDPSAQSLIFICVLVLRACVSLIFL